MKTSSEKWRVSTPIPGNLIRTKIDSFFHFGICVDTNTVIHYASENGFSILYYYKMEIVKSDLDSFSKGNIIEVRSFSDSEKKILLSNVEVCKNAYLKLGNRDYDLLFNNCEHFAYSCCFGVGCSQMIDEIIQKKLKVRVARGINWVVDTLNKEIKKVEIY